MLKYISFLARFYLFKNSKRNLIISLRNILLEISQRHDKGGGHQRIGTTVLWWKYDWSIFLHFWFKMSSSVFPHTQPYLYDGTFKDIFLQFGDSFCRKSNFKNCFFMDILFLQTVNTAHATNKPLTSCTVNAIWQTVNENLFALWLTRWLLKKQLLTTEYLPTTPIIELRSLTNGNFKKRKVPLTFRSYL